MPRTLSDDEVEIVIHALGMAGDVWGEMVADMLKQAPLHPDDAAATVQADQWAERAEALRKKLLEGNDGEV